jgi:hypothetical protein
MKETVEYTAYQVIPVEPEAIPMSPSGTVVCQVLVERERRSIATAN